MSGQKNISSNQQNKNLPQGQDISAYQLSRSIQSFEECQNTQNYQEDIDMLCDSKQYDLQMNQSNSSPQKKSKKDQKESKKKRKSQIQLLFQNTSIKEKENTNKRKNGQTAQQRKEQQEEDEHEKDLQQDDEGEEKKEMIRERDDEGEEKKEMIREGDDEGEEKKDVIRERDDEGEEKKEIIREGDDEGEEKKEVLHDSVHYVHEQERINAKTSFSAVILKQSRNKYRYTNSFTKSIRQLLGHHMSQLFKDEINAHFRKKFPQVKTQQQFDKLTKKSKIDCLKLFNQKKLPKIPKQSLRQLEIKYPDENIRKSYVQFFQEEFQLLFNVYYDTQLRRYENERDQKKSNYSKFIDNDGGIQLGKIMSQAEENYKQKKYNCDQKQSKARQTHI